MPRMPDYGRLETTGSQERTPITPAQMKGWPGGWRPDLPDSHVTSDMIADISNMNWLHGYVLEQRGGYEKVTADVAGMDDAHFVLTKNVYTATDLSAQPSFTQQVYYINQDDGEVWNASLSDLIDEEINATGADLAYTSQSMGIWGAVSSNFFRTFSVQAVTYGEFVYLTGLRYGGYSGVSTDETHNGASGASKPIRHDVKNDTYTRPIPHPLDGTTAGFPSARCAISAYASIFCANVHEQGVYRYPSRVYWTDAGTSETIQTNSYIEVGVDDGQEIVQMLQFNESIMIFKDRSTWVLMGTDTDTFALYRLDNTIGCQSSTGAIENNSKAYFFDDATGLWAYDGSDFELVSRQITDLLMDNINRLVNFKVVVSQHEDRIFLSIPVGDFDSGGTDDSPSITYIYDTVLETWTVWDYGYVPDMVPYVDDHEVGGAGIPSDGAVYFGSPDEQIGIFRLEGHATNDEKSGGDTAISANFRTGWMNPEGWGDRHRLRQFTVLMEPDGHPVTATFYRDLDVDTAWQTATYTPTGSIVEWHQQDSGTDLKTMFSWLAVDFSNTLISDTFQINGIGLTYSTRQFLRGVRPELNQDV